MDFPFLHSLSALQEALLNAVTPQLRAVCLDLNEKTHYSSISFFYDGTLTDKLLDLSSIAIAETALPSLDYYPVDDKIIRLDFPEEIPVKGRFAFLRNEPILPKFEKEGLGFLLKYPNEWPLLAVFRLNMQQALLGRVSPFLRLVSLGVEEQQRHLIADFIYDGEISEKDSTLAAAAIEEACLLFPSYQIKSTIRRVDFPNEPNPRGTRAAYLRQEFEY